MNTDMPSMMMEIARREQLPEQYTMDCIERAARNDSGELTPTERAQWRAKIGAWRGVRAFWLEAEALRQ